MLRIKHKFFVLFNELLKPVATVLRDQDVLSASISLSPESYITYSHEAMFGHSLSLKVGDEQCNIIAHTQATPSDLQTVLMEVESKLKEMGQPLELDSKQQLISLLEAMFSYFTELGDENPTC